jgi:hypothetical protein
MCMLGLPVPFLHLSPSVPIAAPRLAQDLLSFTFVGQSTDVTKTGLHPFIITDGNAEFCQTNAEIVRLYGLINSGEATCSLADLEALTAKEVAPSRCHIGRWKKPWACLEIYLAWSLATPIP